MHPTLRDTFGRPLRNLRLSVTDRCNLRCAYCMPEEEYVWLPRQDLLSFEEIARLVDVFLGLGVDKVRLTGGEPLMRRDLPVLIELLAGKPALADLALTTNGLLLADLAAPLLKAGLHRVTVSLDTLRPERFRALTRRDGLEQVLAGIAAARAAGFEDTKLDTVVLRGVNDDELLDLIAFGASAGAEVRFIEYMDVGGATAWTPAQVVPREELLAAVAARHGALEELPRGAAPADRYRAADGTVFGIIASTTRPFCAACDRSRLTADGTWYLCLYAAQGLDLRGPLRAGASDAELGALLARGWTARDDRGAERRLAERERGPSVEREELLSDPRREMHTRGG
jgi:cyclic pyranopterin phosphate synthase